MHGMVLSELKKFVETQVGGDMWRNALQEAGLGGKLHIATQTYPDQEVVGMVVALSKLTKKPVGELLDGFGQFIIPDLLKIYHVYVLPQWKTLDMLANVENTMHRAVRAKDPNTEPPKLECKRTGEKQVTILYRSPRKLCDFGKGLINGISKHYGETTKITEVTCMNKGGAQCEIRVDLV